MTIGHFLYIPIIALVGLAFGYVMGAKAVRREIEELDKRVKKAR
jgi:proteasome assembly chaperone (PAC2) family protein